MKRGFIRRAIELPLLAKELKELAARRRTYVVRFIYAALLFTGSCILLYSNFGANGTAALGQGGGIFRQLMLCQFAGIVCFLPAMSAGCLTAEKERDALSLLLLTTLRPGQIVVQKWLSRQVPMLSFLLLSFPLLAVAYSYGGVEDAVLVWGIVLLVLTSLQVGAIATMCSSYFRTTGEAFVGTYVIMAGIALVLPVFSGYYAFDRLPNAGQPGAQAATMLIGFSILIFLIAARVCLLSRAFVPPRNFLLQIFRALDAFFNSANEITGGVVLVKDRNISPHERPIAWRETRKKSLGTFRYQFRILTLLEVPILFACQLIRIGNQASQTTAVTMLLYILWGVAPAFIAVHAAGLISSERSRQTLDVLLTLPINGREILKQKFAGVRRLIFVLCVPFLTIYLFEAWWNSDSRPAYVVLSILQMTIYLLLAAWLSMWIGLRFKSHMRAILITFLTIGAVALLPLALRILMPRMSSEMSWALFILSPVDAIVTLERWGPGLVDLPFNEIWMSSVAQALLVHFALFAMLLGMCRFLCFRHVDKTLGRVGEAAPPLLEHEPVIRESHEVATMGV